MKTYTAVVETDQETGLYVGYVAGFPGAHSQGATLEELRANLVEVIEMLLEDQESPAAAQPEVGFFPTHMPVRTPTADGSSPC